MASHVFDFYKKIELQIHFILYLALSLCIIYVQKIPASIQKYNTNPILRVVLFGSVLLLCKYVSYMHGLLLALFVLLYTSLTPGRGTSEGYETVKIVEPKKNKSKGKVDPSPVPKHRWGDELIFDERPSIVENDNVVTEQVQ